jgi:hypothetical protein
MIIHSGPIFDLAVNELGVIAGRLSIPMVVRTMDAALNCNLYQ